MRSLRVDVLPAESPALNHPRQLKLHELCESRGSAPGPHERDVQNQQRRKCAHPGLQDEQLFCLLQTLLLVDSAIRVLKPWTQNDHLRHTGAKRLDEATSYGAECREWSPGRKLLTASVLTHVLEESPQLKLFQRDQNVNI